MVKGNLIPAPTELPKKRNKAPKSRPKPPHVPESVTILALSLNSQSDYFGLLSTWQRKLTDEVWTVNMGGYFYHDIDRIFAMDDPLWQLESFQKEVYLDGMNSRGIPIFTSHVDPKIKRRFPNFIAYPLPEVLAALPTHPTGKELWLDNSLNYMLAYALFIKVKEIKAYGVDFLNRVINYEPVPTDPEEFWWRVYHLKKNMPMVAEPGLMNFCWLLGIASQRGVKITLSMKSTVLDNDIPPYLYGYRNGDYNP